MHMDKDVFCASAVNYYSFSILPTQNLNSAPVRYALLPKHLSDPSLFDIQSDMVSLSALEYFQQDILVLFVPTLES